MFGKKLFDFELINGTSLLLAIENIGDLTFFIGNLETGQFSKKIFILYPLPWPTGSNDTGLMSVWCPRAESISGHTEYYNIDVLINE